MKAQAEIIIVLAVIILMVILVTFVFHTGLNQPDITNLASLLKDDLNRRLYDGIYGVVKAVSEQGGTLDPRENSAEFLGKKIAYWQTCQNKNLPTLADIRRNIKVGIERFVNNLNMQEFQGKRTRLELKDTEVIVRNQDMLIKLTMDTNLAGYILDPLYEIRIPANLAEVYNFASDFVEDNAIKRHFERFLINLIFRTKEEILPTSGILTKCGETIVRTWDDVKDTVKRLRDYSFLNTIFWKERMDDTDKVGVQQSSEEFKYYIPSVNGKKHENLQISFYGGNLEKNNLQMSSNPILIVNSKTLAILVPRCKKDYEVTYSVNSPVIVKVSGTPDYSFNFAVLPFVDNNKIGKCSTKQDFEFDEDICTKYANCDAKLSVFDERGIPIPKTKVTFGLCLIGETGISGQVNGKVPCGISELNVYNPRYRYFHDIVSAREFPNNVTLKKTSTINIHFYRGDVVTTYLVGMPIGVDGVRTTETLENNIIAIFRQKNSREWSPREFTISNAGDNKSVVTTQLIDYMPPDNYTVEIITMKNGKISVPVCESEAAGYCVRWGTDKFDTTFVGNINYDFVVKEDTKDIYLTAFIPEEDVLGEEVDLDYTGLAKRLSPNCNLPISTNKPAGVCEL